MNLKLFETKKRADQIVVDYFLDITCGDVKEYPRHIRAAHDLLELVDGDAQKACKVIDLAYEWFSGFGEKESFRIETVIKKYIELGCA